MIHETLAWFKETFQEMFTEEIMDFMEMFDCEASNKPFEKRKTRSYRLGLNTENVAMLTAIDGHDRFLIDSVGQGNSNAGESLNVLERRIVPESTVVWSQPRSQHTRR
ncbi:MAG: hypothetical protein ACLFQE_07225 [Thermotogota bacterium]